MWFSLQKTVISEVGFLAAVRTFCKVASGYQQAAGGRNRRHTRDLACGVLCE